MGIKEITLYKHFVRTLLLSVLLVAALSRCANMAAPQGGPMDTIPPRIVSMTPPYGTTNFRGNRILIEFNEYIQLKDQQKYFYTSPFMEKKPTLLVKGRVLQIDFKQALDSNQTYALNFGSSVVDNNEGNPHIGLRFVFSTGDYIDSMVMSGLTRDARTIDSVGNAFILFYDAALDSNPEYDSTMILHRPQSVGRAFPNGIFIAENLRPMDYRIYALEDNNGNLTYEPGVDRVGFLDSVYNPRHMLPFNIWFDTTRLYMQADPQIGFNMFMDKPFRRQVLTSTSRPQKNRLLFQFSAPYPQIDTLEFFGIDSSQVITEYLKAGRDSISYWLNMPPDQLPDTVKGRIVYHRTDSLGVLVPYAQEFKHGWFERPVDSKDEKPKTDEKVPNPFKVRVDAGSSVNPENHIPFSFDYPLILVKEEDILLENVTDANKAVEVPFTFEPDTLKIREWTLRAEWKADDKYRLVIPAGTFENIRRETNDTLRASFTIESPDKFSTLVLNVTGQTPESKYIVEIIDEKGKTVLRERRDITTGEHYFHYLKAGIIRIRVIQDTNGNGVWDTGSLIGRRQPERVEMFVGPDGKEEITTKVNWELEFDVNMNDLFAPLTPERMRAQIERRDAIIRKERAAKRAESARNGGDHGHDRDQNQNQYQNQNPAGSNPLGGGFRQAIGR